LKARRKGDKKQGGDGLAAAPGNDHDVEMDSGPFGDGQLEQCVQPARPFPERSMNNTTSVKSEN